MDTDIDFEAHQLVSAMAEQLLAPRTGECLACYVARMLTEFGCDGTLRFASAFRDRRAPRATALRWRLADLGAFCDGEIFRNAYELARPPDDGGSVPPCARVRRGSVTPCDAWRQIRRSRW